ncbi:MAG: MFS transporter [Bacillota bacterium]
MKSEMKVPFAVLCAVPFIMVLGNSMLIPLLPVMKAKMHLTLFQVGLIITAFSIPAGLVIPFAGFISDRYNRKLVMVPALIIYGLGGLISGTAAVLFSQPYGALLVGRIVQGIGAGGTFQLAMALTGDIFQTTERSKALGLLEAANGLGKVVSPIAGAALGLIIWYAPFFVYGALAIPIGIAVWLIVKEPQQKNKQKQNAPQYFQKIGGIFQQKGIPLVASFLSGMAVLFILFGVLSFLSDQLELRYNIRGITSGLIIAIPVAFMALTAYLSGNFLQDKLNKMLKLTIACGLATVTVALGIMAASTSIVPFFIAIIFMGVGTGAVLPAINILITSAASTEERGMITCLYGSMRFFGVAIGPPVFGLAPKIGETLLFALAALLLAGITVAAYMLINEKKLLPKQLLKNN